MAKHTPGPWRVAKTGTPSKRIFAGDELIATIRHFFRGADAIGPLPSQATANARLIAAAPDLLEACKQTLAEMRAYVGESEFDKSDPSQFVFDLLKSAIAKAEGKEDSHGQS